MQHWVRFLSFIYFPFNQRGGCVLFLHNTHIRLKLSCSVSNCGPHKEKQIRIHQREKGKAIVRFRYIIPLTLPLTERDISDGCLSTLGGYSRQKEEDCHHWPPDFVFLDRVDIHMREYRNSYYIHLDFFDRQTGLGWRHFTCPNSHTQQ